VLNNLKEMSKAINRILPGIQTYAWNGDGSKAAVCPQTREILIFETNQTPDISKWKLVQVLKEVRDITFKTFFSITHPSLR
jgi:hypothetical protein